MPRAKKAKDQNLSKFNYPEPGQGMPREIRTYKTTWITRQHPQFIWLLKCTDCGTYRDRDEMYEHPYETECLLCANRKGRKWVSPTVEEYLPPPPKPEPKKEKVYAAPAPKPEPKPEVRHEDTPEQAEARAKMHEATRAGDIPSFMHWQAELKKLQQDATSA